ncbi:hypothetical protein LMG26411_06798 [Cupriavidus numazuensis]|uniref:Uncharacterized protein n=1 Tax=Cupriavidus numazuensis TaxID=221992 RepID=A0ABM8TT21_9BURK|nr:hypothetical protein LMG26411_06798 [Cupriavidus numazuensis]
MLPLAAGRRACCVVGGMRAGAGKKAIFRTSQ